MLADGAYYSQPIAARHPIVFYDGHLSSFSFTMLVRRTLGGAGIDPRLETLFARGIDPAEAAGGNGVSTRRDWPDRDTVRSFTAEADRRVLEVVAQVDAGDFATSSEAARRISEAVHTILEHEAMHQETLLYMWHRLPFELKRRPDGYVSAQGNESKPPVVEWMNVPAGRAALGVDPEAVPFGWDNEHPACSVHVEPFEMERHKVTNARYLDFIEAGGYDDDRWWDPDDWQWVRARAVRHPLFWERREGKWYWRGMFERLPLPPAWPVYVSQAEASAFARWAGHRLPTEAEFQRAAFASPTKERLHPWGNTAPTSEHGVFDFSRWDPDACGTHPKGASAWGIEDLVGNGWEWTCTPFAPLPGFRPGAFYPEYSAEFFDGEHFVMKGASPATARELIRSTFRNWFRPRYPYVYAGFRCVKL
jgi:ergothioneine biosynthesis protein EgtB